MVVAVATITFARTFTPSEITTPPVLLANKVENVATLLLALYADTASMVTLAVGKARYVPAGINTVALLAVTEVNCQ